MNTDHNTGQNTGSNIIQKRIRVDVFSDIACPFCYIGDTRLERMIEGHPELTMEWVWHPFQLQPDLPERGIPWDTFSVQKFGGLEARRSAFAHVIQAGAGEGIVFDFERMPVAPNTMNVHRLVLLASEHGLGKAMALALYKSYFSEACDVTNPHELERIAVKLGLDAATVQAMFSSDMYRDDVRSSQLEAQRLGISGVPFFIFDQKFAVSGAQPVEVFEQVLERALRV
jgi:predicted DsbA family dithiol-disulfide isomerase